VSGTFAGNTAYTATIALTARPGFTLQGVAANFFTVAGATATNPASSGAVAAAFPATLEHPGTPGLVFSAPSGSPPTVTVTGADAGVSGAIVIPAYHNGYPVVAINENAFNGNTAITRVTIGRNVTSIDVQAFRYATNLENVTFASGNQLATIRMSAFFNSGLTSIEIPASVTTIGNNAFDSTANLNSVTFAQGSQLASIGYFAFYNSALTTLEIPASATSMGGRVFGSGAAWSAIYIPFPDLPAADLEWGGDMWRRAAETGDANLPDGVFVFSP